MEVGSGGGGGGALPIEQVLSATTSRGCQEATRGKWHMWPERLGKRARGFSLLRQRLVWSFLPEGAHSEATRRRDQALAEEGHLHFGKRRLLHRHAALHRHAPLASAESRNSPSILILHTTLYERLGPRRSAAGAGSAAIHPHSTRHPSSSIASSWGPPDAPHRRALPGHPVHPRGRALYIGM